MILQGAVLSTRLLGIENWHKIRGLAARPIFCFRCLLWVSGAWVELVLTRLGHSSAKFITFNKTTGPASIASTDCAWLLFKDYIFVAGTFTNHASSYHNLFLNFKLYITMCKLSESDNANANQCP